VSDYTKSFYELYLDYLEEPGVRESHDSIFEYAEDTYDFTRVLDLGCGMSEFARYANPKPKKYVGIDMNPEINNYNQVVRKSHDNNIIIADYRASNLSDLIKAFKPSAAISLFSIEITAPGGVSLVAEQVSSKYDMYVKVFKEVPSVEVMLVSGFYYLSRLDENPVGETGGILSYQTLEPKQEGFSAVFTEFRTSTDTPSKMFGEDVVEVWKFLERA
jgi:hypothetical protein